MPELLIVTKEEEELRIAMDFFAMHGFSVYVERDSSAALALLMRKRYAAILLDGDSISADPPMYVEKLRELSDAPLLYLSGDTAEAGAVRILDAGAEDYIRKPLRSAELCARLRASLRAKERYIKESAITQVLELRGIRVDLQKRRVQVRRREKAFTRREYELLLYFMQHPDQVLTKEQLYQAVWKEEPLGSLATVTMHIKKLRVKIEEKPAYPSVIETAWGMGYVFRSEPVVI